MDVLLLGALAVVLIAITVWIVMWPSRAPDAATASATSGDAAELTPQGDSFEDQYTSATADLSAGAVATTLAEEAQEEAAWTSADASETPLEPSSTAVQQEAAALLPTAAASWPPPTPAAADQLRRLRPRPERASAPGPTGAKLGLGAAALLTLGGAIGGAWLYARWQKERNKPTSRIKRRLVR